MVMVTRCTHRKACLIFDDASSDNTCEVPPWCSSGKSYERKNPRQNASSLLYQIQPPYFSPASIRKIPRKEKNTENSSIFRKRKIKGCRERKRNENGKWRDVTLILFLASISFGMVWFYWVFRTNETSLQNEVLSPIGLEKVSSAIDEECCYKIKELATALLEAEQAIRRTRRQHTLMLTAKTTKLVTLESLLVVSSWEPSISNVFEVDRILEATATAGSGTNPWIVGTAFWGIVPLWGESPPPQTVLNDRRPQPGDCWPFNGSRGEIIIDLPRRHKVNRISVEHILPDVNRSAPRHFSLYGISENGTWTKGLSGEYIYNGPARQYFAVLHDIPPVKRVVFRVLSNQGNIKYTCVYRVHVYGIINKI